MIVVGSGDGCRSSPVRLDFVAKWELDFPTNSRIDRNSGKSVVVLGHVLPSKNITFGAVKQKACSSKNITHWLQSLTKLVSNFIAY